MSVLLKSNLGSLHLLIADGGLEARLHLLDAMAFYSASPFPETEPCRALTLARQCPAPADSDPKLSASARQSAQVGGRQLLVLSKEDVNLRRAL
jgi:hypothetical protein